MLYSYPNEAKLSDLIGKTLESCSNLDDGQIIFVTTDGDEYKLLHIQDCCESVYIEDIVGDLDDLVGVPIVVAEVVDSGDTPAVNEHAGENYEWTFYKFRTIKGSVTIRFYGESEYYSTSVSFVRV